MNRHNASRGNRQNRFPPVIARIKEMGLDAHLSEGQEANRDRV